jgi:hypothetical protein
MPEVVFDDDQDWHRKACRKILANVCTLRIARFVRLPHDNSCAIDVDNDYENTDAHRLVVVSGAVHSSKHDVQVLPAL